MRATRFLRGRDARPGGACPEGRPRGAADPSLPDDAEAVGSERSVVFFGHLAGAFFLLVLALVVFTSFFMWYACRFAFTAEHQPLFLIAGVAVMLGVSAAASWTCDRLRPRVMRPGLAFSLFVAIVCVALFMFQLYVIRGGWFKTDWDVGGLVLVADPQSIQPYLSRYPNQLFLYGLFRAIAALGLAHNVPDTYLSLIAGGALCVTLAVGFAAHAARHLGGIRCGVASLVVLCVLVGASPWILVPYSDAYGILCPAIALWCYTAHRDRATGWLGLAFFSVVGYAIKPTSIFILAAAVFVAALQAAEHAWRRRHARRGGAMDGTATTTVDGTSSETGDTAAPGSDTAVGDGSLANPDSDALIARKTRARRCAPFVAAVLAGALAAHLVTGAVADAQVDVDPDLSFSMTHFLMMGLNTETGGIFSHSDVAWSKDFTTAEKRSAMDVDVWKQRMRALGPLGLANLYHQKLLTAFADGTFAWGQEGKFWIELKGHDKAVRRYYGIGTFDPQEPTAKSGRTFMVVAQTLWLGSLAGVALLPFVHRPRAQTVAPLLAISALGLFLMVFETRARYVYLYSPYFVILASAAWKQVASAWRRRQSRHAGRAVAREGRHVSVKQ